jgi:fructoselysine-6-P-deglycase FrlB-like protein
MMAVGRGRWGLTQLAAGRGNDRATLASVASELREQPSLLRSFSRSALWPSPGDPDARLLFAGAGDSYAASLCASFLAGPPVLAFDPYSLRESIDWAKGREVCIISVSGETRSNIDLAHALKGIAQHTTAITSSPESRLAAAVDSVVQLPFRPRFKSPGIASFALSLAAALRICGLDLGYEFEDIFSRGVLLSKRIRIAARRGGGVTHFAGNNEDYAISIYGAAKIYELLGRKAQASLLEEFSHMQLFSLTTSDTVNVVEPPEIGEGGQLAQKLSKGGYKSASSIRVQGERAERVFILAFAMQTAAIREAKRQGLGAPSFLGARKQLKISDEMIY